MFLFLILQLPHFLLTKNKVLGFTINLDANELIVLTNQERLKNNLPPLTYNEKLTQAAKAKAADMLVHNYWDHSSPQNKEPWYFMINQNYDYHYAGENLSKNYTENHDLIKALMDSTTHRENILDPNYKDIGIAIVSGEIDGKQTILTVQMFGTEFTDQDYIDAGYQPPRQFNQTENQTIENKILINQPLSSFLTNNSFRFMSIFIIGLLFGITIIKLINKKRDKNFSTIIQKYWGHIILFLFMEAFFISL